MSTHLTSSRTSTLSEKHWRHLMAPAPYPPSSLLGGYSVRVRPPDRRQSRNARSNFDQFDNNKLKTENSNFFVGDATPYTRHRRPPPNTTTKKGFFTLSIELIGKLEVVMMATSSTPCCRSSSSFALSIIIPPTKPSTLSKTPLLRAARWNPFSLSLPFPNSFSSTTTTSSGCSRQGRLVSAMARGGGGGGTSTSSSRSSKKEQQQKKKVEVEDEEVEEELPWIQEKALDLVEFTGSVTQALPGPRVGQSSLPWVLAVPLAYLGITFVFAFVRTVRKFNSPREKRRQLVNKNAMLCKSIDELFEKGKDQVDQSALKGLMQKTGFDVEEILRKYIRYVLNEKPFNPDLVANLIQLRKASGLDDSQIAGVLNEISRRIVKENGPVVMDMSGYSEKGFKRKLAVQALFGKVFYLSELPEFCSRDSSLIVKEIFGVADEDAEKIRLHTVSEAGDLDSLEKMVDWSESENFPDESSNAP
nr:uncharacterized protein LOC113717048 [Coffea arabica]